MGFLDVIHKFSKSIKFLRYEIHNLKFLTPIKKAAWIVNLGPFKSKIKKIWLMALVPITCLNFPSNSDAYNILPPLKLWKSWFEDGLCAHHFLTSFMHHMRKCVQAKIMMHNDYSYESFTYKMKLSKWPLKLKLAFHSHMKAHKAFLHNIVIGSLLLCKRVRYNHLGYQHNFVRHDAFWHGRRWQ